MTKKLLNAYIIQDAWRMGTFVRFFRVKSFARSLLDYSDVIYDNRSNVDSAKI
jgi:hypothetical protein